MNPAKDFQHDKIHKQYEEKKFRWQFKATLKSKCNTPDPMVQDTYETERMRMQSLQQCREELGCDVIIDIKDINCRTDCRV